MTKGSNSIINDDLKNMFETYSVSGTMGTPVPIPILPPALRVTTSEDHARIEIERITPPYAQDKDKYAALLHNVFTKEECEAIIDLAERQGFTDALLRGPSGKPGDSSLSGAENKSVRNNQRVPFESQELAALLFARVQPFVPQSWDGKIPYSLNDAIRVVKYAPGTYYKHHLDGYQRKDENTRSYFSFLLYLNDGYEGGKTEFYDMDDPNNIVSLSARQGSVAIFEHQIWHGGGTLIKGTKYAIKSEVMYSSSTDVVNAAKAA